MDLGTPHGGQPRRAHRGGAQVTAGWATALAPVPGCHSSRRDPVPDRGVWNLGPIPIRAYAMCILAGIVVAVWVAGRRLADRGVSSSLALDISGWAVPFGIVGGRLYHVITSPQPVLRAGRSNPMGAFAIWEGGLGIWGRSPWVGRCPHRLSAPRGPVHGLPRCRGAGVLIAQAMGRWGTTSTTRSMAMSPTCPGA